VRNRFRIQIFFLQAILSWFCSKFWKSYRVYMPPAIRGLGLSQSTEHWCWPDCSLKSCYYWLLGFHGTVFWPSDLDDIAKSCLLSFNFMLISQWKHCVFTPSYKVTAEYVSKVRELFAVPEKVDVGLRKIWLIEKRRAENLVRLFFYHTRNCTMKAAYFEILCKQSCSKNPSCCW
jgi:hypothetical protein